MELLSLIIEGSTFVICEKNHIFIQELNSSSKAVAMEDELDAFKENCIENLVK